jgi:hypothetical protein
VSRFDGSSNFEVIVGSSRMRCRLFWARAVARSAIAVVARARTRQAGAGKVVRLPDLTDGVRHRVVSSTD